MEVRALFCRFVWCADGTNNCLSQHHWGFWVQAHTEGVRTQPGRTRFNCLQDRFISLLQVMHTAKYTELVPSYKKCDSDVNFKTQTVVAHVVKYWSYRAIFFQAFNSLVHRFTGSSSQRMLWRPNCFKFVTDAEFYPTNVEPINQVKSNLS